MQIMAMAEDGSRSAAERGRLPLGLATQTTGNVVARPPLPTGFNTVIRHAAPSTTAANARAESQVIALAREAMKAAIEENRSKAEEASSVSNELKPGVTIDLSHKQIQKFPDEVVDIIKHELERLALSHNQISSFPARFAECSSLRYLNVRSNVIRDFPLPICQLSGLEILDLGRNKLRVLPPELVKLTSLKVLSIQKNRIEELPSCLADMTSLAALKLEGNPIRFPPREVLQAQSLVSPSGMQEYDNDDVAITAQIKKFFRLKAISDRSETESAGDESSEGTETPRPVRRATGTGGRFPIKVPGSEAMEMRSPNASRPPPIPSRSHYREISLQNAAARRPGHAPLPLTIGNPNERVRSNSEGLSQSGRGPMDKSKRLGIVHRKATELGTLDENRINRHSHYRGLSHGSAMQGNSAALGGVDPTHSPASPAEAATPRATYVRRLSSLPERKRESVHLDPIVEAAKGILYAVFQIHPLIQGFLKLTRDGTNKRTSLERVYYNANTHVEQLDNDLQALESVSEEDEEPSMQSNENVYHACMTCVNSYMHICALLLRNVQPLTSNSDPRYVRTLMLLLYGSSIEINNTALALSAWFRGTGPATQTISVDPAKTAVRDASITPTRNRPGVGVMARSRGTTALPSANGLRSAVEAPAPPYLNGRAATLTGVALRSVDIFSAPTEQADSAVSATVLAEDRTFEQIHLRLQQSTDMAVKTLPVAYEHFVALLNLSIQHNYEELRASWQALMQKTLQAMNTADALKQRLASMKLKEAHLRMQRPFWELCNLFVEDFTDLLIKIKEVRSATTLFPLDVIALLRPLQKMVKEAARLIQSSPWAYLSSRQTANGATMQPIASVTQATSVSMPLTPQTAALGPAAQATVPTPQSANFPNQPFAKVFNGGFFERADTFLAMNPPASNLSSRTGTMNSSFGSNDSMASPGSVLSPATNTSSRFQTFAGRELSR